MGRNHPFIIRVESVDGRSTRLAISERSDRFYRRVLTEIKAVFSIVTRGTMSISCSEAISSSSGGVTDVLSDCGRAIVLGRASFHR